MPHAVPFLQQRPTKTVVIIGLDAALRPVPASPDEVERLADDDSVQEVPLVEHQPY